MSFRQVIEQMLSSKHNNLISARAREMTALAFDTSPLRAQDRMRVEDGIRRLYDCAAVKFPRQIVWVASPLQGALAAAALASTLEHSELRGCERQIELEAPRIRLQRICRSALLSMSALLGALFDKLRGRPAPKRGGFTHVAVRIWQAVHRPVTRATERAGVPWILDGSLLTADVVLGATERARLTLERELAAQLGRDGYHALTQETTAAVRAAIRALMPRWDGELALDTPNVRLRELMPHLWGRQSQLYERAWVHELLAHDLRACQHPSTRRKAVALRDANLGGQVWLHRDFVVISEPAIEIRVENAVEGPQIPRQQLHCHNGPALRFGDGFALYVSHGFAVDAELVLNERSLEEIAKLPALIDRHAAIERLGWLKYIARSGARPIAEVKDPGNPSRTLALYEPPLEYRSAFRLLRMHNGSPEPDGTFRTFVELVPARFNDPIEAVAWQFGCPPDRYRSLRRRT